MATHPRDSCRRRPRSSARSAGGFTLIELLVALIVGGLLVAIVLELLGAQGRFARLQGARVEAQQNARSALELLVGELRGADPAAIAEAGASTIWFRAPRAWGIVCRHTADRIAAVFPTAVVGLLRTGDELLAIPPVGSSAEWRFLEVEDRTGSGAETAQAQAACDSIGAGVPHVGGAASPARMYAPRAADPGPAPLGIAAGEPGLGAATPLYVFDRVRYQVAATEGVPGWWIRRNTGPALVMHPLAGPVPEADGLRFEYFDAAGEPLTDPATPAARRRIRRVRIEVRTQTRDRFAGEPLRDSVSASVFLRNPE